MKVGYKSNNSYKNAMSTKKDYMMLQKASLNVVIAMHHSPTRSNSIIIELSKVVIKPWMNKVTNLH